MKIKFLKEYSILFYEGDTVDVLAKDDEKLLVKNDKNERVWVRLDSEGELYEVVQNVNVD